MEKNGVNWEVRRNLFSWIPKPSKLICRQWTK